MVDLPPGAVGGVTPGRALALGTHAHEDRLLGYLGAPDLLRFTLQRAGAARVAA